jgi:hypothetical protein
MTNPANAILGNGEVLANYDTSSQCASTGDCGYSLAYVVNLIYTPPKCNPCKIFPTESTFNGNILGAAINQGDVGESIGVYGADYLCNKDKNNPHDGHTYKAFITDGLNRRACESANCGESGILENRNWVLYPNESYVYAVNESWVFTTNESAIYPFGKLKSRSPYASTFEYRTGFIGVVPGDGVTSLQNWTSPESYSESGNCSGWRTSHFISNSKYSGYAGRINGYGNPAVYHPSAQTQNSTSNGAPIFMVDHRNFPCDQGGHHGTTTAGAHTQVRSYTGDLMCVEQ